jgi:TonB family protein
MTVNMVKEPAPEKPRQPDKPVPQPEPDLLRTTQPKIVDGAPAAPPASAPPSSGMTVVSAPPPAELPSFTFDDGARPVETATPSVLYKNLVEYTLRANWNRPAESTNTNFSAEVEITVDSSGRITGEKWQRGSGDQRWDDSVRKAISNTRTVDRPPPAGFPPKVLVRFDLVGESEHLLQ